MPIYCIHFSYFFLYPISHFLTWGGASVASPLSTPDMALASTSTKAWLSWLRKCRHTVQRFPFSSAELTEPWMRHTAPRERLSVWWGNHWKIDTGSTYDTYDTDTATADTIDQYNCTKKIAVQWRGRPDKHYCNFAQVPNGRKSSCRTEVPTSGNEDGKSWIEIWSNLHGYIWLGDCPVSVHLSACFIV